MSHPIATTRAPEAIGTYSQAVKHDRTVYLSGQIPLDPLSKKICSENVKSQIIQVLENLSAVCEASGGNLSHVVKLNVFLTDLTHFALINEAMSRYFTAPYPARAVIGVAALPCNAKVEMDAIMIVPL